MVNVREARPDEATVLTEMAFNSKASNGYSAGFMEACREELTYTSEQISSDDYHFLAAEGEGHVIGFAAIEILDGGECAIESLFVSPQYKSLGVGSGLMSATLDWAREKGVTGIHIQSDPGAVGFYKGIGARLVGSSPSGSIPGRMLPQLYLDLQKG